MSIDTAADAEANLVRVSNALAKASVSVATTIPDMFEAVKEGGATARSAGMDIEQFLALVATMAKGGIDRSRAGTAIKNISLRLTKPPKETREMLDALKIDPIIRVGAKKGDLKPIQEIIRDIHEKTQDFGSAKRTAVFGQLFGAEAVAGADVLLTQGPDFIDELIKKFKNADGAAEGMADALRDTVKVKFLGLLSALDSVALSIGEINEGPLAEVLTDLTDKVKKNEKAIADWLGNALKFILENFDTFTTWGMRMLFVVGALMALSNAFQFLAITLLTYRLVTILVPAIRVLSMYSIVLKSRLFCYDSF